MLPLLCIGAACYLVARKTKKKKRNTAPRNRLQSFQFSERSQPEAEVAGYRTFYGTATRNYPCPGQIYCADGRCVDSITECGSTFGARGSERHAVSPVNRQVRTYNPFPPPPPPGTSSRVQFRSAISQPFYGRTASGAFINKPYNRAAGTCPPGCVPVPNKDGTYMWCACTDDNGDLIYKPMEGQNTRRPGRFASRR